MLVQTRAQAGERVWTHRSPVRLDLDARDDGFVGFEREDLTDEQRNLIVQIKEMHDNGHHTFREIADALGTSKSTAARAYAKWTPGIETKRVSEGESERDGGDGAECNFPGCEEYFEKLEDERFDPLFNYAEGEEFVPTTYEERLLKHEFQLLEDARDWAAYEWESRGKALRLADDPQYKEFLECIAAGRDPLADEDDPADEAAPGSTPYEGGVAAASADGVVLCADSEVVSGNAEPVSSLSTDNNQVDTLTKNHPVPIKNIGPPLLRKEGSFRTDDSAFQTPHSALQRSVDAYGKEIFIEKQDERGRPMIWYKLDHRGHRTQYRRTPNGIKVNAP